jgi:hypothetical protein
MMSAPASASAIAIAAPMPRVPPVTRAVLPASEKREGTDESDIVAGVFCERLVWRG